MGRVEGIIRAEGMKGTAKKARGFQGSLIGMTALILYSGLSVLMLNEYSHTIFVKI